MLVEKVLGNISDYRGTKEIQKVPLEWFELEKKRMTKEASDGTVLGIAVEMGLRDGDILAETAEKLYVADVIPAKVLEISVSTMQQMGRACFELGNRHLSLQINENSILAAYDKPTFEYMEHLGFTVRAVEKKFTGFILCRAHAHTREGAQQGHHHD